ncbi:MAG: hypothetical protein ACR2KQ_09810 [Actinomycetota bacterium]
MEGLGASEVGDEDRDAIQALLDRRAQAFLQGDRAAFLGTVWPPAEGFRSRQRELFGALHGKGGVGLVSYELHAEWSRYGDLARPSEVARYEGIASVAIPLTRERYRLEPSGGGLVEQDQYLTFVKDGNEWFVAADDDLEDVGLFTQRNIWDFTPLRVEVSDNFILAMPACRDDCPASPEVILPAAEEAAGAVRERWSLPWEARVLLIAAASHEQIAIILQATYPVDNYVAFAFWTGEGNAAGPRVILNPRAFTGVAAERATSVLTHELLHVAALPWSGPFMPHFVDEGVAQYVQYGGASGPVADASAASRSDPRVPANHEFYVGTQIEILQSYQRSLSVVAFLAAEHGPGSVERFYRRLGRAGDGPGTARFHLDRALRRVFGFDLRGLERRWASSIGAS